MEGIKGKYQVLFSQGFPALLLMPLSTSEGDKGEKKPDGPKHAFFLFPFT